GGAVGRGGRGVGSGGLSAELTPAEVRELVLDGFFPLAEASDEPRRASRMALQELGLPYAQDAAITRHLGAFLRAHAQAGFSALGQSREAGELPRPDASLLNGGRFNSPVIAERLATAVSRWWPKAKRIALLEHDSLDLAVARGAAHYGLVRRGLGRRIGGGAARAYYVGLDARGEGGHEL